MEQFIILSLIINITGLIILSVLSMRTLERVSNLASNITFVNENGQTKDVIKPDKVEQRETNIYKNRQKKLNENRR